MEELVSGKSDSAEVGEKSPVESGKPMAVDTGGVLAETAKLSLQTIAGPASIEARNQLRSAGYLFIPGSHLVFPPEVKLAENWTAFRASWDQLGPDPYFPEGKGRRERCYAHGAYDPTTGELQRLPGSTFVQYGEGIDTRERTFKPIEENIWNNPIFQYLIRYFYEKFPLRENVPVTVTVHQYRVETIDGIGYPTPEPSPHRDGFHSTAVIYINGENFEGGETIFTLRDGTVLARFTLQDCFDSALLCEGINPDVFHEVSPMRQISPEKGPGVRDVFLFNFDPQIRK